MPYGADPTEPPAAPTGGPSTTLQYTQPPPAATPSGGATGDPLALIEHYESRGQNIPNYRYDKGHTAGGYWQITDTNWKKLGPGLGIDVEKYPTALSADKPTQRLVAQKLRDNDLARGGNGYGDWAPYNPALARAIGSGGGYGKDPVIASGNWKVAPEALAYEEKRPDTSLVWMSPAEYKNMVQSGDTPEDRPVSKSLSRSLAMGDQIERVPELTVKGGKIVDQDGWRRAKAAEDAGVTMIPVAIRGLGGKSPDTITDMRGNARPFDFVPVKTPPTVAKPLVAPYGAMLGSPQALQESKEFYSGVRDLALEGPLQALAHVLPESMGAPIIERQKEREAEIERERAAAGDTGTDIPRIAGRMVAALPLAATGAGPVGAAVGGAIASALTPIKEGANGNFWWEKAKEAGIGGVIGGGVAGAGKLAAQAIAPMFRQPVNALLQEGVRLTPGQMAGGGARRVENALSSIPVLGQMIRSGMRRGIEDFNRAAWNRVLAPLGQSLPKNVAPGRDAAQYVSDAIEDAYNNVIPNLVGQADRPFVNDLVTISRKAMADLPGPQRQRYGDIINHQLLDKVSSPTRGDQLKGIDSMLGAEARGYKSDPLHDNRKLGHFLNDVQTAFRAALTRQNPQYAPALKAANEAWANYVRVSRAAASSGAKEGVFSPAQLRMAVRASDPSLRKMDFGKGEALMQDLSDAAESTLPSTVPDSGTPERLLTERALGLAAGGGAAMVQPHLLLGAAAGTLPYTGAGMNLLRQWATVAPAFRNMLAQPIRQSAVPLGVAGGTLAAGQPQ